MWPDVVGLMSRTREGDVGQQPKELTPHQSPQHYWGAELRAWRTRAGLSVAALGRKILLDGSSVAKIERGERAPQRQFAEACDRVLNAGGALVRLHALVVDRNAQRVVNQLTNSDHVANSAVDVANPVATVAAEGDQAAPWGSPGDDITVPARTPDGRIIFVSVSRRLFLQGLGTTALGVAATPAAIGDAVSSSRVRPAAALAPDLNPVAHFMEMRRVLIDSDNLFGPLRVIPTVREQINVLQGLRRVKRGTDYQQLTQVQAQYAEFAGWLLQDAGDFRAARYWTDRALEWSHVAGDPDLTVFILARKAQLAGDMRDPAETIQLAEAAMAMARPGTKLAAVAATYVAHGYALDRDQAGTERHYDLAHDLLSRVDNTESAWGEWLDDPYIEVHRARSHTLLGNHQVAAEGFQDAIAALPTGYRRDRGVYLAREAIAHAGARDADLAAELGTQALAIGTDTNSGRILTELADLDSMLTPWSSVPAVREFKDAMHETVASQV